MTTVGIVIPILNNFDGALDLIYSAKTSHNLKIYPQLQYRYQVPLAAAWNNGLRQAINDGCQYIIISNDDVLFAPWTIDQWIIEHSLSVSHSDGKVVLTTPLHVGKTFDDPFEICFSDKDTEYIYEEKELFSCVMVERDYPDRVGWFDENFDPCWFEDNNAHYVIKLLGYDIDKFKVPYIHLGNITTKRMKLPINSMKSQQYYEAKWGSVNRNLTEKYTHPYNDPNMSPKDWIPNYMSTRYGK